MEAARAAEKGAEVVKETRSLYHYTNDAGLDGILGSKKLNPSLKANNPSNARTVMGSISQISPLVQKRVLSFRDAGLRELEIPHSEFDVLNEAERTWHK